MEISQSISSSPPPNLPCEDLLAEGRREDYFNIGVTLYEASINGNWAAAQQILQIHPEMVRFAITEGYDTTLHVAASVEETMLTRRFVKNLVARMDTRCLEFQNLNSNTAFCLAAAIGNTQIARIMLEKNPNLVNIPGADGMMPLYMSVLHGKYETMQYLFHASVQMRGDIWTDVNRGWVLQRCVESDLFDVAMEIVADRPDLAVNGSVLGALARKPHVFDELEQNYNLMERFINTRSRGCDPSCL